MAKRVKFQEMLDGVRQSLERVPEHRKGRNARYEIVDAGLGAFSVFYMQSPSFLAHQRDMHQRKGQNNAQGLFGLKAAPSDGQTPNLQRCTSFPCVPGQIFQPLFRIPRGRFGIAVTSEGDLTKAPNCGIRTQLKRERQGLAQSAGRDQARE